MIKKMIFFSAPKELKETSENRTIIFEKEICMEARIGKSDSQVNRSKKLFEIFGLDPGLNFGH